MPIHLPDNDCLHPRLPGTRTEPPRRVRGLLRRAGERDAPHLVGAVDFDGVRCRYRTIDAGDGAGARWLEARPDDDYRTCPGIVVARLLALGRERLAAGALGEACVTDAVVTPDGRVRIAVRDAGRGASRWIDA